MIERLNELTLAQFIDLVCGDKNVLLTESEIVDDNTLKRKSAEILSTYRYITDRVGMKSELLRKEEEIKGNAKIVFLRICHTLAAYEVYDDIRQLLILVDLDTVDIVNEKLIVFIDDQLRYTLFEQHRNMEMQRDSDGTKVKRSEEEIRAGFDSEIAFIMSNLKMNIDMNLINASVYANLVQQTYMVLKPRKVL